MAKMKKCLDMNQLSLFETLKFLQDRDAIQKPPGSMDMDRQFRESISEDLKNCPLSRWQVAARMSELTGQDITKAMLDSWTAESKDNHRFPAIFLAAFCDAVGSSNPLKLLGSLVGVFVLPGPEALRAEIRRLEEEIGKKQQEKKKRLIFLKEMEGE